MFEHRIEELNEKNAEAIMERSDEKRTYTVDEIQDILSISRPTAYNLVKKNWFKVVTISGKMLHLIKLILDCMPSLRMLTINALAAADNVIIPVQAQYLPAKGPEQLLQTVNKVKSQINPKLRIEGILLTIVDSKTNHVLCLFYHVPGRHPGCSWYFLYCGR